MLDFNNLSVRRVIMHNIIAKEPNRDTATTEYELNLFTVDNSVVDTIKQRLIDAAGRDSKSFELEISNTSADSFYGLCNDLKNLNDTDFISRSQDIAELLAENQKRSTIPGGYLIIIDAFNSLSNLSLYIVIKAELHQALKYKRVNGQSQIELLDQVFLSPSQKLYKIGILFEKNNAVQDPNSRFGSFIFDDQFRTDGHPAEYFYKDFLGFSVDANSKIQSKRFYDKTESFIKSNIDDLPVKQDLLRVLKTEFTLNTNAIITPSQFATSYFADVDIRDSYVSEVASELPASIVKDRALIEMRLSKKKIDFPDNINISGPDSNFDTHVSFIQSDEDLENLNPSDTTYTIVKINGKPFSNE